MLTEVEPVNSSPYSYDTAKDFSASNVHNDNNNDVYFKSLSYTNVLFKLEMNAQQNKIFWMQNGKNLDNGI